jgi:hypothetical protein
MENTLYKEAKRLNIPLDHHESDLYLKLTPESLNLIKMFDKYKTARRFTSQLDKTQWFDIPFAYDPFWGSKAR